MPLFQITCIHFILINISLGVIATVSRDCECTESDHHAVSLCASNGLLYATRCQLKRAICASDGNITQSTDESKCHKEHLQCPKVCLGFQDPICGDDGKVYPNRCLMNKRNCGRVPQVSPVHMNFCLRKSREGRRLSPDAICSTECLELYKPVCGSDGHLYMNLCLMKQSNCRKSEQDAPTVQVPLTLCTRFSRCPVACLAIPDPVCGSDGKLYLNKCHMIKDNCGKKVITQMSRNFCHQDEYVL